MKNWAFEKNLEKNVIYIFKATYFFSAVIKSSQALSVLQCSLVSRFVMAAFKVFIRKTGEEAEEVEESTQKGSAERNEEEGRPTPAEASEEESGNANTPDTLEYPNADTEQYPNANTKPSEFGSQGWVEISSTSSDEDSQQFFSLNLPTNNNPPPPVPVLRQALRDLGVEEPSDDEPVDGGAGVFPPGKGSSGEDEEMQDENDEEAESDSSDSDKDAFDDEFERCKDNVDV